MNKNLLGLTMLPGIVPYSCTQKKADQSVVVSEDGLNRTSLPIREPDYPLDTTLNARNALAPARFEVKPPKDAPNVVAVLIDDQGFGVSGAFGGFAKELTVEKLAKNGLKYNRFHTTVLSSQVRSKRLPWTWRINNIIFGVPDIK